MNSRLLGCALMALVAASAQAAAQRPPSVEVRRIEVRRLAPTIRATGQVQSRAAADLAAGVAGRLELVVEPGTTVETGATVARMDTTELSLQRAEQVARVSRADANLKSQARELERLRASGNAVSRFQLDQAQAATDLAKADLAMARATLAQTEERLARSEIKAPFAGVVAERLHRSGEEVNRGDVVARVVNPDDLEIRLYVPLRHVRAVRAGDAVTVEGEGAAFEARVRAIVPAGDARSQSFEVLVEAPKVDGLLAAGTTVQVELPLGAPTEALAVPRDALIIRADGIYVYRIGADRKAEKVAVKPGIADGDWIAIEGGLTADDQVIIRGGESLRGDEEVTIIGSGAA